jgi:hypothetical protein
MGMPMAASLVHTPEMSGSPQGVFGVATVVLCWAWSAIAPASTSALTMATSIRFIMAPLRFSNFGIWLSGYLIIDLVIEMLR